MKAKAKAIAKRAAEQGNPLDFGGEKLAKKLFGYRNGDNGSGH